MKKNVFVGSAFAFLTAFSAQAVDTQCGTFHWVESAPVKYSIIAIEKTLASGEVYVTRNPFVAVTEAATDTVAGLQDGQEVCFKANAHQESNGKKYYVFSVTTK